MVIANQTPYNKDSQVLLQADSVTIERAGNKLINDVSLALHGDQLVGLVGPNGAGKSTLLSALAGLSRIQKGEISLNGQALHKYTDNQRAREIGWMEQFASAHWPVSVEHLVSLGRVPYLSRWQNLGPEDNQHIVEAMTATDCLVLRNRTVNTLSGGELTRVMLARVLAAKPSVLLADEPVAALDIGHQLQTMELLQAFKSTSRGCIVVLHDLSLAARYCDYVYLLDQSQFVAHGAPKDVLTSDTIRAIYGVEVQSVTGDVPGIIPLRLSDQRLMALDGKGDNTNDSNNNNADPGH